METDSLVKRYRSVLTEKSSTRVEGRAYHRQSHDADYMQSGLSDAITTGTTDKVGIEYLCPASCSPSRNDCDMPLLLLNAVGLTSRLLPHAPRLGKLAESGWLRPLREVMPAVTCTAQ